MSFIHSTMLIGYARVSTKDQALDSQIDVLLEAGVQEDNLFLEIASGGKAERPQLAAAIKMCRDGDTFVVTKLDRFGRSLKDLIQNLERLKAKGVEFKSLSEGIDTNTAAGKMLFGMIGAFAEFERDLIRERTQAGLASARARGRRGGRKPVDSKDLAKAIQLYESRELTLAEIVRLTGVSRASIYRNRASEKEKGRE